MTERAVSSVVNYAIMLVVVGLLTSGLLIGVNGHVAAQNDRVLESELAVVGNHLAADLTTADRLAGTIDGNGTVEVRSDLLDRVIGQTYLIDIQRIDANRTALTLTTDEPDVSVTVSVRTTHEIEEGRLHGGDLVVAADGSTLEVRDD